MQNELLRGARLPGGDDEAFLTATTVADPWADPELPSLVAVDDGGAIVGFVACQPRRMWLDQEPVRAVCLSHLDVEPSARTANVGPQLMRQVLAGPQDLTFSDTASEIVARLWRILGGAVDDARRCDWVLTLRATRWAAQVVRTSIRQRQVGRAQVPVAALPFQAAGRRLLKIAFPGLPAGVEFRATDAAGFVVAADTASRRLRVRPRYDVSYVDTLLKRVALGGGDVVSGAIADGDRVAGAAVYVIRERVARVLAVLTTTADAGQVLGALAADAKARGAVVLTGRNEPVLAEALNERLAVLGFARRPIVHTRNPEIRDALLQGSAVINRLDSDWWLN
jgi:hypothetical protein